MQFTTIHWLHAPLRALLLFPGSKSAVVQLFWIRLRLLTLLITTALLCASCINRVYRIRPIRPSPASAAFQLKTYCAHNVAGNTFVVANVSMSLKISALRWRWREHPFPHPSLPPLYSTMCLPLILFSLAISRVTRWTGDRFNFPGTIIYYYV